PSTHSSVMVHGAPSVVSPLGWQVLSGHDSPVRQLTSSSHGSPNPLPDGMLFPPPAPSSPLQAGCRRQIAVSGRRKRMRLKNMRTPGKGRSTRDHGIGRTERVNDGG